MRRSRLALVLAATAASVGLVLTGCATDAGSSPSGESTPGGSGAALSGELTVYAAASLKNAFDRIAEDFERENPGVDILPIVYDGSSTLVTQLSEGASADVFASADEANMQKAADADLLAGDAPLFATNTLVIAVPGGNPGGVADLADLSDPELSVVLCAPEVPCGAASVRLLGNAGVDVTAKSFEQNVTAVLTKVAEGVADAGLVYRTDVVGQDSVESIAPAGADEVVNRYPIADLADAENPEVAAAFVAWVTGPEGQAALAEYGFGAP